MENLDIIAGWRIEDLSVFTKLGLLFFTLLFYGLPILIIVLIAKQFSDRKKNEVVWLYDEKTGELITSSEGTELKETVKLRQVDKKDESKFKIILYIVLAIIALNIINYAFTYFNTNIRFSI